MTASKRGQGRSRILLLIGISLMFFSWLSRVIAPDLSGAPLLELYEQRLPISMQALSRDTNLTDEALQLWISIMQAENVLNPVQGKPGLFTLFRTHHTVNLVAETRHSSG